MNTPMNSSTNNTIKLIWTS